MPTEDERTPAGVIPPEARIAQLEQELAVAKTALRAALGGAPGLPDGKSIDAQLLQADRMASMGALAAGVAHEVNNPLGFTLANVTFALDELQQIEAELTPREGERADELEGRLARARGRMQTVVDALHEAQQGSNRVRLLVRDLKTFAGGNVDRSGRVDVRRVLESAINMAFNVVSQRARLVKDYQPAPMVEGNEAKVAQVFLNLLLNAAEATREGDADNQQIRVVLRTGPMGSCLVEVSDTGHGISPENQARVFDPFFTTKAGSGTGLGLAMCHTIVAAMGGHISIESTPGKGTAVHVLLPGAKDDAPVSSGTRTAARPVRRGRVLVIDDEPMMGRAVQRLLADEHEVEVTADPVDAMARLRAGARFDVILCDLMMPTLSGMDVHAAVLALDDAQARRIVFMTGGAYTPKAAEFLENVENPRLEKPIDRATLRALVRAQLA